MLLANQRRFDEKNFGDHPFIEESKIIWVPIWPEMRSDNFFQLELGTVSSDDNRFQPYADYMSDEWPMYLW